MLMLAIACIVIAALAFLNGFVTEFRQSRRVGPYAIVPTLPWGVAAAIFVDFGFWFLSCVPWWTLPFVIIGATLVFGYGILRATRKNAPPCD